MCSGEPRSRRIGVEPSSQACSGSPVTPRRFSGLWTAERTQMSDPESIHVTGQSKAKPRTRAEAKITVHSSEAKPYDQTSTPTLVEIQLRETFSGDIEGKSLVRALQVLRGDRSASMVSVQRFHGKIHGREGTFVLQGSEVVENG